MVPDAAVVVQDGEFVIVLNDEAIPVLGVNPDFEAMASEKSGDRTVQRFAADSVAGGALVHPHRQPAEPHAAEGLPGHRRVPARVLPKGPEGPAARSR